MLATSMCPTKLILRRFGLLLIAACVFFAAPHPVNAQLKTWDGRHSIDQIRVTMVYFVPKDRKPLPDWRERLDYFARRIERFHERELTGQSKLQVDVIEKPMVSQRTTNELREGDGDAIFFRTLREADAKLKFAQQQDEAFPILLVMSDINWRPLDDFYRLKPTDTGPRFEGQLIDGRHHPGAASGGARATYIAANRKGWGLVSADGWRVPYCGSDCVAYHEGVGHTVGIPHPQPGNGSVMSLGQYQGWINESWLDVAQKRRLGWKPSTDNGAASAKPDDLFSTFTANAYPPIPKPGAPIQLRLSWPKNAKVQALRVRLQQNLWGPWRELPVSLDGSKPPKSIPLGKFSQPTPLSYRVDVKLENGEEVEQWGYLQVREQPAQPPQPKMLQP